MTEQWEVKICALSHDGAGNLNANPPPGWEPFAVYNGNVWVRRKMSAPHQSITPPKVNPFTAEEKVLRDKRIASLLADSVPGS